MGSGRRRWWPAEGGRRRRGGRACWSVWVGTGWKSSPDEPHPGGPRRGGPPNGPGTRSWPRPPSLAPRNLPDLVRGSARAGTSLDLSPLPHKVKTSDLVRQVKEFGKLDPEQACPPPPGAFAREKT